MHFSLILSAVLAVLGYASGQLSTSAVPSTDPGLILGPPVPPTSGSVNPSNAGVATGTNAGATDMGASAGANTGTNPADNPSANTNAGLVPLGNQAGVNPGGSAPLTTSGFNPIVSPGGVNAGGANSGPSATRGSSMSGFNPLLAATLTDNPAFRALALPYVSQLGPMATMYYATGGADQLFNVMYSDMVNRQLSRYIGNPLMSTVVTNSIVDTPDQYVLNNLLFNRQGMSAMPTSGSKPPVGTLPPSNGAASIPARGASSPTLGRNPFTDPFSMMLFSGAF